MKAFILVAATLASFNSFGASIKDCDIAGRTMNNVIVPSAVGTKSIKKILNSQKTEEQKTELVKKVLYVEGVSIGDGKSICDLAQSTYSTSEETCMDVLDSDDLLVSIMENYEEAEFGELDCVIGVSAKLFMQFKM